MSANYYKHGDYNIMCDRCYRKRKRSQCAKQWDGLLVCINEPGCFDRKHPLQDPPRVIIDGLPVRDPRPERTDIFLSPFLNSNWESITERWEIIDSNWEDIL